ncbi:hypothetical protein CDAR_72341 [Caerostris darwini]|uniref:Uncharacterized protein n=1 Tax=Caerostris darwini TaxID=1538125 RepID=A0AAV4MKA2_9ARAC|nr:hypothetical protein CDAR_72341 [Caerostris darwini]
MGVRSKNRLMWSPFIESQVAYFPNAFQLSYGRQQSWRHLSNCRGRTGRYGLSSDVFLIISANNWGPPRSDGWNNQIPFVCRFLSFVGTSEVR